MAEKNNGMGWWRWQAGPIRWCMGYSCDEMAKHWRVHPNTKLSGCSTWCQKCPAAPLHAGPKFFKRNMSDAVRQARCPCNTKTTAKDINNNQPKGRKRTEAYSNVDIMFCRLLRSIVGLRGDVDGRCRGMKSLIIGTTE